MEGSKAVAVRELPSLADLLEPCDVGQRQYICLLARGLTIKQAARLVEDKAWTEDSYLPRILDIIRHNKDYYQEQASELFLKELRVKSQVILEHLIDMGMEKWDELKREDKSAIMQAIGVVSHRTSSGEGKGGESYEELILRKHIALPKQNILSAPKEAKSG